MTRELGVNLAGVEIILNMREKMGAMQNQIEEFVATLNREMAVRFNLSEARAQTSLIPVVRLPAVAPEKPPRKKSSKSAEDRS